ncbi:MAG TPA: hypothetical protein PLF81_24655 [Candidatus Anammoximicrobium sp.]|nr:hypothetical protein [Candidatus Anammoximicrobium sp.]
MTTTRLGASKKYAQNWSLAFRQKSEAKASKSVQKPKAAAAKKTPKKKPVKGKGK